MNDLIDRVASAAGIAPPVARTAVGVFLGYLDKQAPGHLLVPLYAAVLDAHGLAVPPKGGLLAGLGGGVMGVYADLAAAGLSSRQMQQAGEALVAVARERAGDDAVNALIAAVPALRQLL